MNLMPVLYWNEVFGPSTPTVDWPALRSQGFMNPDTAPGATFVDHLIAECLDSQNCSPKTVSIHSPDAGVFVQSNPQSIWVGFHLPATGIFMKTVTQKWYLGHGRVVGAGCSGQ